MREREGQVEGCRAVHVDGVQRRVRAFHRESSILRDEQDVRNVVAPYLVQVAPLLRQVKGLATGNVLEVDDGVSYAALRADYQSIQVNRLFGFRIADLLVLGNREPWLAGYGA